MQVSALMPRQKKRPVSSGQYCGGCVWLRKKIVSVDGMYYNRKRHKFYDVSGKYDNKRLAGILFFIIPALLDHGFRYIRL